MKKSNHLKSLTIFIWVFTALCAGGGLTAAQGQENISEQEESLETEKNPESKALLEQETKQAKTKRKAPRSILFPIEGEKLHIPKSDKLSEFNKSSELNKRGLEKNFSVDQNSEISSALRGEQEPQNQDGILVDDLSEDHNLTAGPLHSANGGFSEKIWQGSKFSVLAEEIKKLRPAAPLTVRSALYDRLFLTSAKLPDIQGDLKIIRDAFLQLRLAKIIQKGNLNQLKNMVGALEAGSIKTSDNFLNLYLLSDQFSKACTASSLIMQSEEAVITALLEKVDIMCRASEGDRESVQISLDMMVDMGSEEYEFFDLVGRFMEGQNFTDDAPRSKLKLTPVNLYLLLKLKYVFEKSEIQKAPSFMLQKIALDDHQTDEIRAEAISLLSSKGAGKHRFALSPADLIRIYNGFTFEEKTLQEADQQSDLSDALIYRAALAQENSENRLNILKQGGGEDYSHPSFIEFARVNRVSFKEIIPSTDFVSDADRVILSLLHADEFISAQQWYHMLVIEGENGNVEAEEAALRIWPLLVILNQNNQVPWDVARLKQWWDTRQGFSAVAANNHMTQAAYFYALSSIFSYDVPSEMIRQVALGQEQSDIENLSDDLWQKLMMLNRQKASDDKLGETILSVLKALQNIDISKLNTLSMTAIIKVLRHAGLEKEARQLAFEALLAKGF